MQKCFGNFKKYKQTNQYRFTKFGYHNFLSVYIWSRQLQFKEKQFTENQRDCTILLVLTWKRNTKNGCGMMKVFTHNTHTAHTRARRFRHSYFLPVSHSRFCNEFDRWNFVIFQCDFRVQRCKYFRSKIMMIMMKNTAEKSKHFFFFFLSLCFVWLLCW